MRQLEQQRTVSGNSPETLTYAEAAAQTFEKGAPVILTAGKLSEALAAGATGIAGIAAVPATGKTDAPIPIWVANDDTVFGVSMPGGVQADVGKLVMIKKTGALWTADRAGGAGSAFLVQEVDVQNPGNQPIARGHFVESTTQLSKTA